MTIQEYKDGLKAMSEKYEREKALFAIRFAKDNNPYNIGDIVRDHIGAIKIEQIYYSRGSEQIYYSRESDYSGTISILPCATFKGTELTKDLKPVKRQTGRTVYQSNIIEKIS